MILIFSDQFDHSTTKVMEYLIHWGEKVIRLNREDTVEAGWLATIDNRSLRACRIRINDESLSLKDIKSVWFRKGGLYFRQIEEYHLRRDKKILKNSLNDFFAGEQQTFNEFVFTAMLQSTIRVLGNPLLSDTKKLTVLQKASSLGLDIPATLITTHREDVGEFIEKNGAIITKAIQDNISFLTANSSYGVLTNEVDRISLDVLPPIFYPSLFQQRLEKQYDIRIFFLCNDFYSMAIFSQDNPRTWLDFRNYDQKEPNRKSVCHLPVSVKRKLTALMKDLRLNTGSIDMVYTTDNRYVFLEVNPVGQYDMLGKFLNFQLDKKIATWLAKR